jgi:hypothetical protein
MGEGNRRLWRGSNDNGRQTFGPEAVSLEHLVVRNDSQLLNAGLSNDHPIKRITVYSRQPTGCHGMSKADR